MNFKIFLNATECFCKRLNLSGINIQTFLDYTLQLNNYNKLLKLKLMFLQLIRNY